MMEEKYLIGSKEFILRDDLSDNELEKVERFVQLWKATDKKTITGGRNYSREEVADLVKILLMPIDGSNKDEFDFGQLTNEKKVLIIADFVKKKAQENFFITQSLKKYK